MLPVRFIFAAFLLVIAALPASAASFDCAAAATPFEHAICDSPELSRADEIMAKTFATATGGLTKASLDQMRADQRTWLDFAQRACTEDAKPLATGRYDEDGIQCLVTVLEKRGTALEQSRMLGGHRFYIRSLYSALADPDEADSEQSYWKVGTREITYPLMDNDDPVAEAFNAYMAERMEGLAEGEFDGTEDTAVSVVPEDISGENRITLKATPYWFPHGAAHGNYAIQYLNYYIPTQREVIASDIFAGDDWEQVLTEAAWEQVQTQHQEWLLVDDESAIADIVIDPTRWDLSDDYGLVIQFGPYEIAPYAYGAPTVTVSWEKLQMIQAETQEALRHY